MADVKKHDESFEAFLASVDFEKLRGDDLFAEDYGRKCYIETRNKSFIKSLKRAWRIMTIYFDSKNKDGEEWNNFFTFVKNCLYLAFQSFSKVKIQYYKATDMASIKLISNTMTFEGDDILALAEVCKLTNRIEILSLCSKEFEYEITIEYCFMEAERFV